MICCNFPYPLGIISLFSAHNNNNNNNIQKRYSVEMTQTFMTAILGYTSNSLAMLVRHALTLNRFIHARSFLDHYHRLSRFT